MSLNYVIGTFIPSMATPLFSGVRSISIIWQQATFFLSFLFYILSATTFRKEFRKMFKWNAQNNRLIPVSHFTQARAIQVVGQDTRV